MFNKDILELYGMVKLGIPVHIVGELPKVFPRKEVGRNNTGRDIVAFQFALRKAGFEPGNADGRFGPEMEQAIYRLQNFYGLALTGKLSFNEQLILGFR
jgi:peptidoglycan hydrolase-like protein with peptidoglycan-binding domain